MDLSDIIPLLVIIGIPLLRRSIRRQDRARPRKAVTSGRSRSRHIHEGPVLYPQQQPSQIGEPKAPAIEQNDTGEGISIEMPAAEHRGQAAGPVRQKKVKPAAHEVSQGQVKPEVESPVLLKDSSDLIRAVVMAEVLGPPKSRRQRGSRAYKPLNFNLPRK